MPERSWTSSLALGQSSSCSSSSARAVPVPAVAYRRALVLLRHWLMEDDDGIEAIKAELQDWDEVCGLLVALTEVAVEALQDAHDDPPGWMQDQILDCAGWEVEDDAYA